MRSFAHWHSYRLPIKFVIMPVHQFSHDDVIKWKHFPRYWPFVVAHRFPTQRSVTRSFDIFFDLRLNKRLSKQSWGWWFETLSFPLWRQYNDSYTPGGCCYMGYPPRMYLNTLRPRQNGRHFADDIFNCIFLNENFWISNISLKCVPYGLIEKYVIVGSDNGLAPNKRQAIIWSNGGLVYWRIYASVN